MNSLSDWHLLPHRRGHDDSWWMDFDAKRLLVQRDPLDTSTLSHTVNQSSNKVTSNRVVLSQRSLSGDIELGGNKGFKTK